MFKICYQFVKFFLADPVDAHKLTRVWKREIFFLLALPVSDYLHSSLPNSFIERSVRLCRVITNHSMITVKGDRETRILAASFMAS